MADVRESIEIARRQDEVFAYIDDLTRHGDWQASIVRVEADGPTRVGQHVRETRRMGKREMTVTYEITVHDPPRTMSFRGLDGPIRPVGTVTVEPVGDESSCRVTLDLDLVGHGFGKIIGPMARKQARREVPESQRKLKELLESGRA